MSFNGSEDERRQVLEQLERLLSSTLFANSKRYPNLLRYAVVETLEGRTAGLKERTIGVEVFGRDANYDTTLDPIVRTSAAQVRQRMSQYYAEPGHEAELRIELVPGSYVPQFRWPLAEPVAPMVEARRKWRSWRMAAPLALLAAVGVFAGIRWGLSDAVDAFWGIVWDKGGRMIVCAPGNFPADPTLSISESLSANSIAFPDATVLYRVVAFAQEHRQPYQVRRDGDSGLADFRTGPTVFIGGLNHQWLLKLTARCRFTYQRETDPPAGYIRDAQNPQQRRWRVMTTEPYSTFDEDYGVLTRMWDPSTEHIIVVASGIASYGTIAAGEFLTTPKYLEMIRQSAPPGWEKKNLQVVFSTKVLNGAAGPPKILAIHVW